MKYDRHIDKTEERKLQEKLRFAGEKVPSMKRRSNINDYYGRRIYMVTMAVEGRRPLLGTLRGSSTIAGNQEGAPCVVPTPLGQEVTRCWELIPEFHHEVRLLAFQLMPDHLHGILFVQEAMEEHLGQVISGFKAGCNKAYRQMVLEAVPQRTLIASASAYEVVSPPSPSLRVSPQERFYKPGGAYFEACSNGKLLLMEPDGSAFVNPTIMKATEEALRRKAEAKHYSYSPIPVESQRYRFVALNEMGRLLGGES